MNKEVIKYIEVITNKEQETDQLENENKAVVLTQSSSSIFAVNALRSDGLQIYNGNNHVARVADINKYQPSSVILASPAHQFSWAVQKPRYAHLNPRWLKLYWAVATINKIEPVAVSEDPIILEGFKILPDHEKKTLFYYSLEPVYIDLTFVVHVEEQEETQPVTGGRATLTVSCYRPDASTVLGNLKKSHPELADYRSWKLQPVPLRNLSGTLKLDSRHAKVVNTSENVDIGSVIFSIDLTESGANHWHDELKTNVVNINGDCNLNFNYYTRKSTGPRSQSASASIPLKRVLSHVTPESISVIDPQVTFKTIVRYIGHPQVSSANITIKPNKNIIPKSFTPDPIQGEILDFTFNTRTLSESGIQVEIVSEIDFKNPKWPVFRQKKTMGFRDQEIDTQIKPEAWFKRIIVATYFKDQNGQIIRVTNQNSNDKLICTFNYTASYLRNGAINHVYHGASEELREILLPLPIGDTPGNLKLTVLSERNGNVGYNDFNLDINTPFFLIESLPDGRVIINQDGSPNSENSLGANFFGMLEELYGTKRPHLSPDSETKLLHKANKGQKKILELEEENDEIYEDELAYLEKMLAFESIEDHPPLAIPPDNPAPFAPLPPDNSFWPIITSSSKGREVAYQRNDGSGVGRTARRWLANRSSGTRYHAGIDLFGNYGDPVVAIEDGIIKRFYHFYSGTYALFVEHSNVVVNYGEVDKDSLSRNNLRVGDRVTAGQVIGFIGRLESGNSMLHFETYQLGTTRNYRWMQNQSRPSRLLNPTKYLLYLKRYGLRGDGSGNAQPAPYGQSSIDLNKAIRLNKHYAEKLRWESYRYEIYEFLGFDRYTPGEDEFAYAIADWQREKGFDERDVDGILGRNSWQLMQSELFTVSSSSDGISEDQDELNVNRAVSLNRRYSEELGWSNYRLEIYELLGYYGYSPSEEELVNGVADWQYYTGFPNNDIDGVIGPYTWDVMKEQMNLPPNGDGTGGGNNDNWSSWEDGPDSGRDNQSGNFFLRNINRVWSWYHSGHFLSENNRASVIEKIAETKITDYVISLNLDSNAKYNQDFRFIAGKRRAGIISSLESGIRALNGLQNHVDYHFMVFINPKDRFVRELVEELMAICQHFQPRSILLDAEGWWRNQSGKHQNVVSEYIVGRLKPFLSERNISLGFTDFMLNDRGIILASVCDYLMPQAYSTLRNDGYRDNGGMQRRKHQQFQSLNKKMVMALAAWNLRTPNNNYAADDYQSMQHTIEQVEDLIDPYIHEVAYWWLTTVYDNSRGAALRKQFIKDLSSSARRNLNIQYRL